MTETDGSCAFLNGQLSRSFHIHKISCVHYAGLRFPDHHDDDVSQRRSREGSQIDEMPNDMNMNINIYSKNSYVIFPKN